MSVCKGRRKTENPPPFFFDYLSFFLIRIFWIGQDPLPLMKKMVKQLSFWSKMVKKKLTQFLVKKGQKKFGLWPRPSKSLHIAFLLRLHACNSIPNILGSSILNPFRCLKISNGEFYNFWQLKKSNGDHIKV